MPFAISFNRNGPSSNALNEWYARWRSNDVARKPLNSMTGSENAKKNGSAWCVSHNRDFKIIHDGRLGRLDECHVTPNPRYVFAGFLVLESTVKTVRFHPYLFALF